jgi:obg-like ATPase 1
MEISALMNINAALLEGKPARSVPLTEEETKLVQQLCLLTMKPVIFAANVAESDLADASKNSHVERVLKLATEMESEVVLVSAQVMVTHITTTSFICNCVFCANC